MLIICPNPNFGSFGFSPSVTNAHWKKTRALRAKPNLADGNEGLVVKNRNKYAASSRSVSAGQKKEKKNHLGQEQDVSFTEFNSECKRCAENISRQIPARPAHREFGFKVVLHRIDLCLRPVYQAHDGNEIRTSFLVLGRG